MVTNRSAESRAKILLSRLPGDNQTVAEAETYPALDARTVPLPTANDWLCVGEGVPTVRRSRIGVQAAGAVQELDQRARNGLVRGTGGHSASNLCRSYRKAGAGCVVAQVVVVYFGG